MAAFVSYSAQDSIMESRPSHVTFGSSKNINDVESGLSVKDIGEKTRQLKRSTSLISWIKQIIPYLSKLQPGNSTTTLADADKIRQSNTVSSKISLAESASGIERVHSAPSSVTFRVSTTDQVSPLDTHKQFVSDFVSKEMLYHADLQESFLKVSSHLDVLNHLGGGEYLQTYDQDLVDGLLKMSLFFIQSIRIAPQIEWRGDFEDLRVKYESFATKMEKYMANFEKEFPGSTPALERTGLVLSGVRDRLEIYQRICLIPSTAAYWKLSPDLRKVIDVFYKQEKEYRGFLKTQPEALDRFQMLGILDSDTGNAGAKAATLLFKASEELAENMIYNPCTYGLIHRKMEIAEAFEAHTHYTTVLMERLYDYRDATSRTWHKADEDISDEQLEELIAAFKKDVAKPIDRLIHFQHLLEFFKSDISIDQVQVTFAKYVVDGVLKEFLVKHAFQITPTLTPKWG